MDGRVFKSTTFFPLIINGSVEEQSNNYSILDRLSFCLPAAVKIEINMIKIFQWGSEIEIEVKLRRTHARSEVYIRTAARSNETKGHEIGAGLLEECLVLSKSLSV